MILADTSIWIDHFRRNERVLAALLERRDILCHPFIRGELACGSLAARSEVLLLLARLPQAVRAQDEEVLRMIEERSLMGTGIGYLDAHLLASTLLTRDARLWTRDRRLAASAHRLGIGFTPP